MDDIATAAVEAALAAGASYADARVMETRTEAMAARNGAVETLDREERAGVGVRALIGSSWGFFAVPDVGSAAARRAGEQAAAVARASTLWSPGRTSGSPRRRPSRAHWESECREDPWTRQPRREGRPPRGRDPDDASRTAPTSRKPATGSGTPASGSSRARAPTSTSTSSSAARAMNATAVGEGETQRRRYPGIRGQYGTRGWELVREIDLPGQRGPRSRSEARALLTRRPLPLARRDGPDPRRRADGAPDPRVGRPRDGARPDPRLGGGVRRHVLARPEAARLAPLRRGADEHHRRRDAARRRSAASATTTRARPPTRSTS